jgi:hypothetical protein
MAQSGLGMDTLTRGVKQLSDQIVQSRNPNSQAAEKFNQLGITATSVDGVLEQLADRFGMMPDGADKTRIAVEMFGKAGQDLIPILNKGSAGLRESMEASKRLGAVLSDDTVKSLAIADDAFDTLGVATRAAANQFAGLMAPAVGAVTESFAKGVGAVATFFGALNEGSKGGENTIQFLKTLNPLIQKLGGPGFNVEAMEKQAKDMASFGDATKQLHDELIAKLEAEGKIEEEKGMRLRSVHIAAYRDITAEMKAQEQLGRNQMEIEAHAQKDRNAAFGLQLQQQEELNNMQFAPATISPAMAAHEAAVENLIRLMPELNHQEAALQALFNAQSGHDTVVATTEAFKYQNKEIERGIQALLVLYPELSRAQAEAMAIDQAEKGHNAMIQQIADHKDVNKELELGTEYAKANYSLQEAFYRNAPGLIGQADLARQRGFELLQAENDLRRRVIDQTIFDEERKGAAIFALDKDLQAKRMGILNQFPTFWEQQLNAIVASNAFSLSSITSNFNNATAQWIQGQGDFTQFWQQTQTTLLTSALQFTEQWLVQLALAQLKEIAMVTTQEATKNIHSDGWRCRTRGIKRHGQCGHGGEQCRVGHRFDLDLGKCGRRHLRILRHDRQRVFRSGRFVGRNRHCRRDVHHDRAVSRCGSLVGHGLRHSLRRGDRGRHRPHCGCARHDGQPPGVRSWRHRVWPNSRTHGRSRLTGSRHSAERSRRGVHAKGDGLRRRRWTRHNRSPGGSPHDGEGRGA